jgi:serine/threonine-protein kinase SRPK3
MNGSDIKKAAINKAKQVAQAANGNGGKKRRKGQDLKPIITASQDAKSQDASPASAGSFHYKYVGPKTVTVLDAFSASQRRHDHADLRRTHL